MPQRTPADNRFDNEKIVIRRRVKPTRVSKPPQLSKEQKMENGTLTKHEKIDKNTARTLQQGRCAKGLTQKQLSQQMNIPIKTIQDIENGKALKNRGLWQRMARFLGVTI